jgi:putative ABC transport system permease protein
MLRTYLTIAWRNILKNGLYSVVNVVGLLAGIAFALLIGAYAWGELQVNRKLRHADRQYLLTSQWKDPNMGLEITTLAPLGKFLKEQYPHLVANYYRWDGLTSGVSKGDKHFRESIQLGDSTLLPMYGFELLHGDARTALKNPYSVVITASEALKYFGRTDVVGQTLSIQSFSGGKREFGITGVLKEIPENSVTQINAAIKNTFFIPTNTFAYFGRTGFDDWNNTVSPSYVELREGVTAQDLAEPIRQLIARHAPDGIRQNLAVRPVALTDYYLWKDGGLVRQMVSTLALVGAFILLMAVVNFINLAVSRSGTRLKEVGVRKVLGGLKRQLVFQFLAESVLLVGVATVLAFAAYPALRPLFAQLIGKEIPALSAFPAYFGFVPVVIVGGVGLAAGLYPAFVIASLDTVDALKGKLKTVKDKVVLRKLLVGFQFCLATIVLIAAAVVTQQVGHFLGGRLGYDKAYIVSAQVPRDWSPAGVRRMETVRNEFAALPEVSSVSLSHEIPNGNNGGQPMVYKSGTDSARAVAMQAMISDENYLNTYRIPLRAGAFFDGRGLDSGKVVLNERAVRALGYPSPERAVGGQLRIPGDPTLFTIKGVTRDFHFGSMQAQIQPMIFFNVRTTAIYRYLSFKVKPGDVPRSLEAIGKKWAVLLPGSAFQYAFHDDILKGLYQTEIQLERAAYAATVLALIIVLLGVLGLVSVSMQRRVKEIGVRKVLGASVPGLITLFIKEFLPVVAVASVAACPLVYVVMQGWLSRYASRIALTPYPFVASIVGLGTFTVLLIGLQAARAALANPAESLRNE